MCGWLWLMFCALSTSVETETIETKREERQPLNPPNSASISPASKMLPSIPVNTSVFKNDISGSNRPSAAAATGDRVIPFSASLFENLVCDTSNHCFRTTITQVKAKSDTVVKLR